MINDFGEFMSEIYQNKIGNCIITGGAGFIGSHLVDKLVSLDIDTKVFDNLSAGSLSNLSNCQENKKFSFVKQDLKDLQSSEKILEDVNSVFHIAAEPEVRSNYEHPEISYNENIYNTFKLLESIRKSNVKRIYFTSSSTVYGEPKIIPTPEDYGPTLPISPYGASKLAAEALISAYCHNYGITAQIFRFANVVGHRNRHGVIIDFINKLKQNKLQLEILGDGKQSKSYIHITDCIQAILHSISKLNNKIEIVNIGNLDEVDVISIAKIVCHYMCLKNVKFTTKGGDDGRGWPGDVTKMNLDISKLRNLGWNPKLSSKQAIEKTVQELIA